MSSRSREARAARLAEAAVAAQRVLAAAGLKLAAIEAGGDRLELAGDARDDARGEDPKWRDQAFG